MPVTVFALLDAYYLALEKGFRDRFKTAAQAHVAGAAPDFVMSADVTAAAVLLAVFRPAILLLHGLLALTLVAVWLLLCSAEPARDATEPGPGGAPAQIKSAAAGSAVATLEAMPRAEPRQS